MKRIAEAEGRLKELFYKLDDENVGRIKKSSVLANIARKGTPWGSMLAVLRGGSMRHEDVEEEAAKTMSSNAAKEIEAVFEGKMQDGSGEVTWEEWLSYLETLRVDGPRNGGGVDRGVMMRNLALARVLGAKKEDVAAAGKEKEEGGKKAKQAEADFGGPERLEMLEVQSLQRGIRIKEGPPSVARRAWGNKAEGVRSRKRKASNIDPISGLPYTEDDYKRIDAEDQRKRQAKVRQKIIAHEAGVSVEELMVKNSRLRKQLKEEIVKGRQSKTGRAVKEGRTKRMMNAEVELAVLAKSLKDKGVGGVTVYGLTHEDGNMTGER